MYLFMTNSYQIDISVTFIFGDKKNGFEPISNMSKHEYGVISNMLSNMKPEAGWT